MRIGVAGFILCAHVLPLHGADVNAVDLEAACRTFEAAADWLTAHPELEEEFTDFYLSRGGVEELLAEAAVKQALGVAQGGKPVTVQRACFEKGLRYS